MCSQVGLKNGFREQRKETDLALVVAKGGVCGGLAWFELFTRSKRESMQAFLLVCSGVEHKVKGHLGLETVNN